MAKHQIDQRDNLPWRQTTATYDDETDKTTVRSYFGRKGYTEVTYPGRVTLDDVELPEEALGGSHAVCVMFMLNSDEEWRGGWRSEAVRLLRSIADKIEAGELNPGELEKLKDAGGNFIGTAGVELWTPPDGCGPPGVRPASIRRRPEPTAPPGLHRRQRPMAENRELWRCQRCGYVWEYTQWFRRTHCKQVKSGPEPGTMRYCGGLLVQVEPPKPRQAPA
jgi:hypothetical protein